MCHEQSRQLTLLTEQSRTTNETAHEVVARVQDLVKQYHAQNVAQATMIGDLAHIRDKVDAIEKSLEKDFALRSEFAEIKSEWRKFLGIVLTTVALGFLGFMLKGGLK
jgi:hypothetical protein